MVNDAGYSVLRDISLDGLDVCEIGPGTLPHRGFWKGTPANFTAIDTKAEFLAASRERARCPFTEIIVNPDEHQLPLRDESIDLLLSFYSFEHLHPLADYLDEYARLLKPGGRIVGAIPNEGGLAWGLGRFLSSRRWVHANTDIDYDKIICWEHPNFCDTVISELEKRFVAERMSRFPPIGFPSRNLTLLTRFIFRNV